MYSKVNIYNHYAIRILWAAEAGQLNIASAIPNLQRMVLSHARRG